MSGNTVNVNNRVLRTSTPIVPQPRIPGRSTACERRKINRFQRNEWALGWIWRFRRLVLESRERPWLGEHGLQRFQRRPIRRGRRRFGGGGFRRWSLGEIAFVRNRKRTAGWRNEYVSYSNWTIRVKAVRFVLCMALSALVSVTGLL